MKTGNTLLRPGTIADTVNSVLVLAQYENKNVQLKVAEKTS